MNACQSNMNCFHYQDYICPTCNGRHDHYSGCRMFEFDNRNNRKEEAWRISYLSPRVIQETVEWSHVPSYEPPPIIEFYPQQKNLGVVQHASQMSCPERYATSQMEREAPLSFVQSPSFQEKRIKNEALPQQDKTYQIRVASLNKGQLVWITIEPRETGETITQKIYSIAGFRTRKVHSICTGSGRLLDKRSFVFSTWDHIEQFKHGEIWKVEWEPVKPNVFEKVMNRIIKV